MTYIKIGDAIYPASISGQDIDRQWDNRASKTITLDMTHSEAADVFINGLVWSILMDATKQVEMSQEDGTVLVVEEEYQQEYDNSEYCVAGTITDHRNGTLSIKMGKRTDVEKLEEENAALLFENLTGEEL